MADPCTDICCGLCWICCTQSMQQSWCFFCRCCMPRSMRDDEFAENEAIHERQRETMNFAACDQNSLAELREAGGNGVVAAQPNASRSMDLAASPPSTQKAR